MFEKVLIDYCALSIPAGCLCYLLIRAIPYPRFVFFEAKTKTGVVISISKKDDDQDNHTRRAA
jgi:hypothetical protein